MKKILCAVLIVFAFFYGAIPVNAYGALKDTEFFQKYKQAMIEQKGYWEEPTETTAYTGCTLPPPNPTSAIKAHNTSEPTAQPETAQPTQEGVTVKLTVTTRSISAAALTFSLVSMAFSVMSYRNSKRREKDFL